MNEPPADRVAYIAAFADAGQAVVTAALIVYRLVRRRVRVRRSGGDNSVGVWAADLTDGRQLRSRRRAGQQAELRVGATVAFTTASTGPNGPLPAMARRSLREAAGPDCRRGLRPQPSSRPTSSPARTGRRSLPPRAACVRHWGSQTMGSAGCRVARVCNLRWSSHSSIGAASSRRGLYSKSFTKEEVTLCQGSAPCPQGMGASEE